MTHQVEISPSTTEQIEYHKIRELLAGYTRGIHGRQYCLAIHPTTDLELIQNRLDEVFEYTEISALTNRIQLSQYEDVTASVNYLAVEGYVLPQEDIHEIGRQMEQVHLVHRFFEKPDNRRDYKSIYAWTQQATDPVKLIRQIRAILDEKGDVRNDASPELLSIAKAREAEVSRLNREFLRLIAK